MKHRQKKSPVWKVIVFIFFVIVFAMVLVRLNKEREMRARVEQRARELADAAAQASAEYAEASERSRMAGSDDYVEEIARESLGMVMPGETVFVTKEE
ncbi:MAG: septum formation initiator family protein [Clostridiales bacterium]|nr:septum formation initiator family protein [Clostridiales bacterium]